MKLFQTRTTTWGRPLNDLFRSHLHNLPHPRVATAIRFSAGVFVCALNLLPFSSRCRSLNAQHAAPNLTLNQHPSTRFQPTTLTPSHSTTHTNSNHLQRPYRSLPLFASHHNCYRSHLQRQPSGIPQHHMSNRTQAVFQMHKRSGNFA